MKTGKLFETDAYIKRFKAAVLSCEADERGYKTVLDKTAFFPEGGGQPSDIGNVSGVEVFDVQIQNGEIFHFTRSPFKPGEEVTGEIDFDRRFNFMQNHTAEHIVSGLVFKKYGFNNIGFHLNENEVTFDFDGFFTPEQLTELETEANRRVWLNLPVTCFYPEAGELEKIAYRAKSGITGDIRLVKIEDTDICACCAPHVKRTGEIGAIKFLSTEKQHGGTRIFMKCGAFALLDYREKTEDIKTVCAALSAKTGEAAKAVLSLAARYEEEKQRSKTLKSQMLKYEIKLFDKSKQALFLEEADIAELQAAADGLHKAYGGVRIALAQNAAGAAFVMCGGEEELSLRFADLKSALPVKGGGRGNIRQGSITAPLSEIKDYFKTSEKL
ncbi:MAG: alanyl-tRNA editing protein [Clostridia bacterium]|nr:alanyl-tRNA editing protein [Clostridia bacterium]